MSVYQAVSSHGCSVQPSLGIWWYATELSKHSVHNAFRPEGTSLRCFCHLSAAGISPQFLCLCVAFRSKSWGRIAIFANFV